MFESSQNVLLKPTESWRETLLDSRVMELFFTVSCTFPLSTKGIRKGHWRSACFCTFLKWKHTRCFCPVKPSNQCICWIRNYIEMFLLIYESVLNYEGLNILELKFSIILVSGPLRTLKNYWDSKELLFMWVQLLMFAILKI